MYVHLPLYNTNSSWHLLNNYQQAPSEPCTHLRLGDLSDIETEHAETWEDFSGINKSLRVVVGTECRHRGVHGVGICPHGRCRLQ